MQQGFAAETISGARYAVPTQRYGHFALGRPHEYAVLQVITSNGRSLELRLPDDEVFEDLAPRLVRLAENEPQELLTIVSRRDGGARLVLFRLGAEGLQLGAQSKAIGTPMRWLNPVGAADFDGDSRSEIAAVITPHIGGILKLYQRRGVELVELVSLGGFSNHVYGSPELELSIPMMLAGRMRLLVPDQTRRQLRIMTLQGGQLLESGRCQVQAPISGALRQVSEREVSVGLTTGRQTLAVDRCAF